MFTICALYILYQPILPYFYSSIDDYAKNGGLGRSELYAVCTSNHTLGKFYLFTVNFWSFFN